MIRFRKALSLALALVMCLGIFPVSAGAEGEVSTLSASDHAFDENDIVFTFANLSDPHVGYGSNDEILRRSLETIKKYAKNGIDAVLFNGDQTQDGKREQAELVASIVKEAFDVTKIPVIFTHGNHDVYWAGCMSRSEFVSAYGSDMYLFDKDMESIYDGNRHVEIDGYHFVSVDIETYMPGYNTLSPTTEAWLKNTLDKIVAQDPDKYIFVSCHSPAKDTVYGSMTNDAKDTGNWGASAQLDSVLKNYPQVILFSGHTHYAINLESNINQTTYTQINSGSSSDIDFDMTALENRRSYSQGMIVEVDSENNIRITRIDLARDQVIRKPWYIDAYKADGSSLTRYSVETRLENNRAPQFPAGIEVTEVSSTELRVDFKSAIDDDMVYYYVIEVVNAKGTVIASRTIVTPFYDDPGLTNMPKSYSAAFTGKFEYPYTVKVRAYDCFYKYTELSQTMADMTEENTRIAQRFDDRIKELMERELTESDLEYITTMHKEIGKLGYKVKFLMTRLGDFEKLEREYYNKFFITECTDEFAPKKSETFSTAPMSSSGWVDDIEGGGVKLNWKNATKNYFLGFNTKQSLDGLHIGFTGLEITSDNKNLAIMLSNTYKDKWLTGEGLLINIDLSSGSVSLGSGASLGRSDLLTYSSIGPIPFELKFDIAQNGDVNMNIVSPVGTDTLIIPSAELSGISHLTDTTACYVSLSPWATKSTMSVEITAIHTEEKTEPIEPDQPTEPTEPDEPTEPTEQEKGFFERIGDFFRSILEAIGRFFTELFGG